ncbi:RTA1-domain-containing protein [Leucogyrophana mollusca]|uniref:RTA1-domain-containing protein n=1 Tax=Leucogyrophana mollusca TaxID=85980 RepID=A0ACB8B3Q3_9AGAM|nr:RTA1-domain-containing protein [Leucogyrophana mollusca]
MLGFQNWGSSLGPRAIAALLLGLASRSNAGDLPPPPANPYLGPSQDPDNILKYITSNTLTGIAFALILTIAFIQTYWIRKWGPKWMLCLVIGEYTYALGFALRFGLHYAPDSRNLYIVEDFFVVLSPCAFIAADYILLGRIARYLDCAEYLLVPSQRITAIFVTSDITTFMIQAAGGGISVSNNISTALAGEHIFLAGLALQLASFFTFTCIYCCFLYRVHKHKPEIWAKDRGGTWYRDWRVLAGALSLSCVGILVRSVYRVVELSQGYQGYLTTTEAYFYGLDTLPLLVAISAYIPFWPGRFIPSESTVLGSESQVDSIDKDMQNSAALA